MALSRRQPLKGASPGSRQRLGLLLQVRREDDLGYGYESRPAFEERAGVNRRMCSDIERARRDTFDVNTLRFLAKAYQVTLESVIEVAWGRADALAPVVSVNAGLPGAAGAAGQPHAAAVPDQGPLFGDAQVAADRPYADEIHRRLRELARRGTDADTASGAQVFPRPGEEDDAAFWDWARGDMWDLEHRLWMTARIRRQRAERLRAELPGAG